MKKFNINGEHESGAAWEDELNLFGLADLDLRCIERMLVGQSFTDQSDSIWYRVQ